MKKALLLLLCLVLFACGGIKQENKNPGKPEIKINPKEISFQTPYTDTGTWNEQQVTVSTGSTSSGTTTPVEAEVTISWSSNNIKVFQGTTEIQAGGKFITKGGSSILTVKYFSQRDLEYKTSIIFQFQSATESLSVSVTRASNISFSLKAVPNSISYTAKADEAETWKTTAIKYYLTVNDKPLSDSIFVFTSHENIKLIDSNGNYTTSTTIKTDSTGWGSIGVTYKVGNKVEYSSSIEAFFSSQSVSVPVTVSYEKPIPIKTTLSPLQVTFQAPPEDTGTWRSQYFTVITTDANGTPTSGKVTLAASSQYTQLIINSQPTQTATVTTDSNGVYVFEARYYTQSYPTKVNYTAQITANEQVATLTISGSDQQQKSYNLSVAPASYTHTYTGSDAGTWNTVWFTITLNDNTGNPVQGQITITSPNQTHTRLYDNNTLKPSPMTVTTNAQGQYFLRLDYYTEADYSVNPPYKLTYSGQMVVSFQTTVKTVNFEVK